MVRSFFVYSVAVDDASSSSSVIIGLSLVVVMLLMSRRRLYTRDLVGIFLVGVGDGLFVGNFAHRSDTGVYVGVFGGGGWRTSLLMKGGLVGISSGDELSKLWNADDVVDREVIVVFWSLAVVGRIRRLRF